MLIYKLFYLQRIIGVNNLYFDFDLVLEEIVKILNKIEF